ncbi:MAG TPA: hypothetical protein VNE63_08570 [Candidatus Acidoferrales bacterium]|nr:hypothetical protein [Candidatus Acidoferrales bacterium]
MSTAVRVPDKHHFVSTKQVAESLGISRDCIEKYIAAGELDVPRFEVGERKFRMWNEDSIAAVKKLFNSPRAR